MNWPLRIVKAARMDSRIARIIMVLPALIFGLGHLGGANEMVGMVPDFIPLKLVMVYLSGVGLIAGALAVILNKMTRLGALLLCLIVLIIGFTVFLPGMIQGDQTSFSMFWKDLALAGGYYYIAINSDR